MTPNFDKLVITLLEADVPKKKKARKKKGHNYKFDSRSGKYYKPNPAVSEGYELHTSPLARARPEQNLDLKQETDLINWLSKQSKPYPTASEIISWANNEFGKEMSVNKQVANNRLADIFTRHEKLRIKRLQGHSRV